MFDKNSARLRRAKQTRAKIRELGAVRLTVTRTNSHIYAQVTAADGSKVFEKNIDDEPEKYFTKDILDKLDAQIQKEFKYGKGSEV